MENNNVTEVQTPETAVQNVMPEAAPSLAEQIVEATAPDVEYKALKEALTEARTKLALLLCGVAKEKLSDGAKIALGLVAAGMEPETAAAKAVEEYPHLKLAVREVPKFAAQASGSGDGFAAIKSIFAKK
ncbi:MAG: hypothetical protein IJZ95_08160 [Oscillospiraceae bacterium]|nr:hypothetical protein [Oscillospiraceae bacterium]